MLDLIDGMILKHQAKRLFQPPAALDQPACAAKAKTSARERGRA